jgi:hypothetical protein
LFNSSILDVAVGLVFVFLIMSLICSAASEGIESFVKQRAKNLEKGIRELLGDLPSQGASGTPGDAVAPNPAADPQAAGQNQPPANAAAANKPSADAPQDFVYALYNHGLINALYRGKYGETPLTKLPSYIPSANFALAVLELRKTGRTPLPQNLRSALDAFEMKAKGDLNMLQRELENWYDSSMDRVSGWYKRRTQMILAALGLAAAIAVNADCIDIARRLSTDPNLRQSVARIAEESAKHPPEGAVSKPDATKSDTTPSSPGAASDTQAQAAAGKADASASRPGPVDQIRTNLAILDGINLPIGWRDFIADFRAKKAKQLQQQGKTQNRFEFYAEAGVTAARLHGTGWIITALAVSLGAPFWFDLLNKIMVVRSTVKPKEKSKEEKSKDPTSQK